MLSDRVDLTSAQRGWRRAGRWHRETTGPDPAGDLASSGSDEHSLPENIDSGEQEPKRFTYNTVFG